MNAINPLFVLLALQALDLVSTVYFMSHPALGLVEGNPVLAKLFTRFGVLPVLVAWKGGCMAGTFYYQALMPAVIIWAFCGVFAYTVINNFKLIRGA